LFLISCDVSVAFFPSLVKIQKISLELIGGENARKSRG